MSIYFERVECGCVWPDEYIGKADVFLQQWIREWRSIYLTIGWRLQASRRLLLLSPNTHMLSSTSYSWGTLACGLNTGTFNLLCTVVSQMNNASGNFLNKNWVDCRFYCWSTQPLRSAYNNSTDTGQDTNSKCVQLFQKAEYPSGLVVKMKCSLS